MTLSHLERSDKDRASYERAGFGDFPLGTDSVPNPNISQGVFRPLVLAQSPIYPGNDHACQLYLPAGYSSQSPAPLMVFLDAAVFLAVEVHAAAVLDNLIHRQLIPPLIAVFLDHGNHGPGLPLWGGDDNRSVEYDSVDSRFVDFLQQALFPPLFEQYSIQPGPHAIAGFSSSGAAAFTAAWQRPDIFDKVLSFVGSFTNIRGAHDYPSLVRRAERKPIRVFLQSGSNDLDIVFGDWAIANKDMASALAYRDYDYRFEFGNGGHSMKHGAAILPEALRWLWREKN